MDRRKGTDGEVTANTAVKPTPRGRRRELISSLVPRAGRLTLVVGQGGSR